jgi:outer membrane lipoprotein LolB
MKYQIIVVICALLLSQLSGCVSVIHKELDQPAQESPTLSQLDHWKITGKLAIRTPQKAQSINLVWQQQDNNYNLKLNGPLGFGSATIIGDPKKATIQQGSKVLTATPNQLGIKLLGMPLSADALRWWIKGLTSPNHSKASNIVTQENSLISSFQQNGWRLKFSDYKLQGGYNLPKKISGRRGDLSFKLVVTQWHFFN